MSITAGMPSAIRKVTLELIYDAVDERTHEIKERLDRIEDDNRSLRNEMNDLRSEINRRFEKVDQKFDTLQNEMNHRFGEINARFETLNGRFDQLFALIVNQRKD